MLPPSFETKTDSESFSATPTKILGVAVPRLPLVESKVTNEIPMISPFNPSVSVGSGMKVPIKDKSDMDLPKSEAYCRSAYLG